MKSFHYFTGILLLIFCIACVKSENPYIDNNAPAPANVSDVQVESTPGGAVITYKLPNDPNLAYVKAIYEIRPGVFREARSSLYTDTLKLVGFGDTNDHTVNIYSVGRNEKESAPVPLTVTPLEPPFRTVFKTLELDPTFGGVGVSFANNGTAASLALVVMRDTTGRGTWAPITTFYTGMKEGVFAARGIDTTKRRYAVYVKDRWDNYSDTLIREITPFYEELIPKTFAALRLPGDSWQPEQAKYSLENIWDNIINNGENIFASAVPSQPTWVTVDLRQTAVFSRMKLHQRTSHPYNGVWIKTFEIYGAESYSADGSWDNWTLLGRFNSRIPSGSVWPAYTASDMDYQRAGEDFEFDQPQPRIRYLRFKVVDTYGGGKFQFSEFTFWGQVIK